MNNVLTADEIELIKEVLEKAARSLEEVARELTEVDERYERNDLVLKAQRARAIINKL